MHPARQVIGPITLVTSDLAKSAMFYVKGIGLEVPGKAPKRPKDKIVGELPLAEQWRMEDEFRERLKKLATVEIELRRAGKRSPQRPSILRLGNGANDLVALELQPTAKHAGWTTGLFHMAILLPSRKALARQLKHFIDSKIPIQGASDHGVSEAIYLSDPDGNGIEIYADRPREAWVYRGGLLFMPTLPLDVDQLLKELDDQDEPWRGIPAGAVMGHIHLRVSDLPAAEAFYHEIIGMDVTARYDDEATFMSFDGYHHHLGLNTWESKGKPPAPEGSIGLKYFQINLADDSAPERVKSTAQKNGVPFEQTPHGISLRDPSGNVVILHA